MTTEVATGAEAGGAGTRHDRRKARTRAALIGAAQRIFAEQGSVEVSIQEITEAADVGFGSFYSHFATKVELFDAAVAEAFEAHATWLDDLLGEEKDPAVVFATSLRLTGRLPRTSPEMARILGHASVRLLRADRGLAPRARRDIEAGVAAGRFDVGRTEVAVACTAGALVATLQLAMMGPVDELDEIVDEMTVSVLRMLGLASEEARVIASIPLPPAGQACSLSV